MSLRQAFSSLFSGPRDRKPAATVRLRLEALEDRFAPAIISVGPSRAITTISGGITAAAPGDTLQVDAATYNEQLVINKNLSIIGAGAGSTIVQSPTSPTQDTNGQRVMVKLGNSATVNISSLTVRGPTGGAGGGIDIGLLAGGGATLNLSSATVSNITEAPFNGVQTGYAIVVGSVDLATIGHATINNVTISNYQKTGIVVSGTGSNATITSNIVTGLGDQAVIGQNGIQVDSGATASIIGNNVSGNLYSGPGSGPDLTANVQSTGILLGRSTLGSGAGSTLLGANIVTGNDIGVYSFVNGTATLNANTIAANRYEGVIIDQGVTNMTNNTVASGNLGVVVIAFAGNTANSQLSLTSNTIRDTAVAGIRIQDENAGDAIVPALTTKNNTIVANGMGIENQTTVAINAPNNFYGFLRGPINPNNPLGLGNSVVGNVNFGPWASSSTFGCFINSAAELPAFLYVVGLFDKILHRGVDDFGLCFWAPRLLAGATREDVAMGIRTSPEAYNLVVESYYQTFLKRPSDFGGKNTFVNALLNGTSENQVIAIFVTSPEYTNTHPDDATFVTGLYNDILGRQPDAFGLASWLSILGSGTSRATIVLGNLNPDGSVRDPGFLTSLEYARKYVMEDFTAYLGRAADDSGRDFWAGQYLAGLRNQQRLDSGILASDEFFNLSQNKVV